MDEIAYSPDAERKLVFEEVADKTKMLAFLIEKDFWISWILEKMFNDEYLADILCFKGGTSLSKTFKLIERFSEDIDLILSQKVILVEGEKLEQSSNTKQARFNKEIEERAMSFISTKLREKISITLGKICSVSLDPRDGHVLHVRYPEIFEYTYLRPDIKLEIGPLALWNPNEKYPVFSYVTDVYPNLKTKATLIPTVKPERIFWEKITILHHEHYRPISSPIPSRYSRHYYDVYKMGTSDLGVKTQALSSIDLLKDVVDFKQRFYPRGWARYDEAREGILHLSPKEYQLSELKKDYDKMHEMIFGDVPEWDDILSGIKQLEEEIRTRFSR